MSRWHAFVLLVVCAALLACESSGGGTGAAGDAVAEAAADALADVNADAATPDAIEASPDAIPGDAVEANPDPAPDAGPDATPTDVTEAPDAALDATPDVLPTDATDATDVGPLPAHLTLDPASLVFGSLPIGSYRPMISGHDPAARTCVSLIWYYDSPWDGGFCDTFPNFMAYAIVTPDTDGPCGQWEYGGDVGITALSGCADWSEFGAGHANLADFTATLTPGDTSALEGPLTVTVDNRSTATPPPVTLGIRYSTDIPEDVWIQSGDAYGLPDWFHVRRDGQQVVLFDRCDLPVCGEGSGVCGMAFQQVHNLTHTSYGGEAYLTWDGRLRVEDPVNHCWLREPAPAGDYEIEACFAWATEDTGAGMVVTNPMCLQKTVTLPADLWLVVASMGG